MDEPRDSFYTGGTGQDYYERRSAFRSDEHQRRRSLHFAGLSRPDFTVLDFGCGNGGVLSLLPARRRWGVEIAPDAVADARQRLDEVHQSVSQVPLRSVDLVISFHALEHSPTPYEDLKGIHAAMRPGAGFRFIVPFDGHIFGRWRRGDPIMHLFAWTPLTFGNLLETAGFQVAACCLEPSTISERLKLKPLTWAKALLHRKVHIVASGVKQA